MFIIALSLLSFTQSVIANTTENYNFFLLENVRSKYFLLLLQFNSYPDIPLFFKIPAFLKQPIKRNLSKTLIQQTEVFNNLCGRCLLPCFV